MSPDREEHRRKKWEHASGTVRLHQKSHKVYGGGLQFARQRERDNGLRKATETERRQKWGRKS